MFMFKSDYFYSICSVESELMHKLLFTIKPFYHNGISTYVAVKSRVQSLHLLWSQSSEQTWGYWSVPLHPPVHITLWPSPLSRQSLGFPSPLQAPLLMWGHCPFCHSESEECGMQHTHTLTLSYSGKYTLKAGTHSPFGDAQSSGGLRLSCCFYSWAAYWGFRGCWWG